VHQTLFDPKKTPVTSAYGVGASNHSLGSSAGLEMRAMGDHAIDAAASTLFTLNVAEPMLRQASLGEGDCKSKLETSHRNPVGNHSQPGKD